MPGSPPLDLLLAQSREIAFVFADPAGIVTHWSPGAEEIFGFTPAEIVGKPIATLFRPEDRAAGVPDYEMQVALTIHASENDRWMARADGSTFWANGVMMVLRDAGGGVAGFVKILRNRTDNKEQLDTLQARVVALEHASKRKDAFLSTLSHELRGPLAPLATAVDIIRMSMSSRDSIEQALRVVERQMQILRRLVDDLLDTSRIEAGKLQLELERLSVGRVLQQAVEDCAAIIRQKAHQVRVVLPMQEMFVEGDRKRLHQVFVNLITNAAKYTPQGGMIRVSAATEGTEIVTHVEDNGIGIGPDVLPTIFELFTQAESSRQLSEGGLGIGLALVRDIVSLHHGSVQVRSDGLGKGSEFTVRLPAA